MPDSTQRLPLQATHLAGSEAVPEGGQDHGGVALAPAVASGGLDELIDLPLCLMLTRSKLSIRPAYRGDLSDLL